MEQRSKTVLFTKVAVKHKYEIQYLSVLPSNSIHDTSLFLVSPKVRDRSQRCVTNEIVKTEEYNYIQFIFFNNV